MLDSTWKVWVEVKRQLTNNIIIKDKERDGEGVAGSRSERGRETGREIERESGKEGER